jgi:hypothetical protein
MPIREGCEGKKIGKNYSKFLSMKIPQPAERFQEKPKGFKRSQKVSREAKRFQHTHYFS